MDTPVQGRRNVIGSSMRTMVQLRSSKPYANDIHSLFYRLQGGDLVWLLQNPPPGQTVSDAPDPAGNAWALLYPVTLEHDYKCTHRKS